MSYMHTFGCISTLFRSKSSFLRVIFAHNRRIVFKNGICVQSVVSPSDGFVII